MNLPGPLHRTRENGRPSLRPAWIPVLLWTVLPFQGGCGSTPLAGPSPDDDRPTLPSTVVTDESPDSDGPVAPGGAETPGAELSILARPVFCCNPLAVDFEAVAEDSSWLEGASFYWDFGDGRTRGGPSPTHAYASPGVYVISLAVEGADGRHVEATAILELAQVEGGDISLVAWDDGADSEAGPGMPEVGDRVRATLVGEPVVLTLRGADPDDNPLLFSIVSDPAFGDLGPIEHVAPDRAEVTYTPGVGFEGEDSFSFAASNGTAYSAAATFEVVVAKRILPWVEVYVGSDEGVNIVITGLLEWRKITDTAIVSVDPGQTSFFSELKEPLPDMRIIPGVKTSPLFGRRQFDSVEKWGEMAEEVRAACEASGQQRFLFENESALFDYYHDEHELDLDSLRVGLNELPKDVQYLWYPSVAGGGETLERYARLCEVVEEVLDVRFIDHASLNAPQHVNQPGTLTAVARLESIAQNPTIPLIYCCGDRWWPADRIPEALEFARLKWGDATEAIVYPGQALWVQRAQEMGLQQPALGPR